MMQFHELLKPQCSHSFPIGASLNRKTGEIEVNSSFKAEEWGIDWDIYCFADVPHLGKSIRNALINQKQLYIDKKFVNSEEYDLPTNIVDVAAIRAVIDYDKHNELKLAPHLSRDALDLGNYCNTLIMR